MTEREEVLRAYQEAMSKRWEKRYLDLEDVRALKIFCQVYQISHDEHDHVVALVGLDSRQMMDEENCLMDKWLAEERALPPVSKGGLAFSPSDRHDWKKQLPTPPLHWQNLAAVGAGIVLLVSMIVIRVTLR